MTDGPESDPDPLKRVLALTPVGRQELRDPQSGLSLPQRWLLGHLDGESSLEELAALPGSPAAERLPRDAAKLAGLGLALDMGEPGPTASSFGPSTLYGDITLSLPLDESPPPAAAAPDGPGMASGRRRAVWWAAAAVGVVGAGSAWMASRTAGAPDIGPIAAASAVAPARAAPGASPALPAPGLAAASAVPSSAPPGPALGRVAPPGAATASAVPLVVAERPAPAPVAALAPATGGNASPAEAAGAAGLPPRAGPASRVAATEPAPLRGPLATPGRVAPSPGPRGVTAGPGLQPAPGSPAPVAAPVPTAPTPTANPVAAAPAPVPAQAALQAATPPVATPLLPLPPAPTPSASAVVATAAPPSPSPAPAPVAIAPARLQPVSQVEPAFPREGLGIGSRGVVLQARLVVAPSGAVTQVSFVQSSAATRVFERAARSALLQWRFPEGAGERVVVQSLRFSEE